MSTVGSRSVSPAAAAPAPAVEDTSGHWAPHGPVLTACVVGINVLMILLIVFFFWRYFSRRRGPSSASSGGGDDDDDASSSASLPVASPWASSRRRRKDHGPQPVDDVASALPVYVYSSSSAGEGGKAPAECAVCIVELRDGDPARRLPRCGHRFHADCVGAWLRLHATCPLCRASVVVAPEAADGSRNDDAKDELGVGADCPV